LTGSASLGQEWESWASGLSDDSRQLEYLPPQILYLSS
jgi:hypothetical protein